ncbi:MAG: hypothetical protein NUV67_05600 [archaeon]|nr:hypothetical protein [archaeon]
MRKRIVNHKGVPLDSRGNPIIKKASIHLARVEGSKWRGSLLDHRGREIKPTVIAADAKELERHLPRFEEAAKNDPVLEDARQTLGQMQNTQNVEDVMRLFLGSKLFQESVVTGKLAGSKLRGLSMDAKQLRRWFADLVTYEYERKKAEWEAQNQRLIQGTPKSRIVKP